MNFKEFIKDRTSYIIIYGLSTAVAIIIMNLTLIINRVYISKTNILYAFLISAILIIVFLMHDYYKNKRFYNQLNLILKAEEDLDSILNLGRGNTAEEKLFRKILLNVYRLSENKTVKYEKQHKEYIYFVNQWVHQMKTPVSVINLTLQDEINEENKEVFESILEENEKLQHGIDMMLYNARLNEFNLDFNVEELSITKVLRQVINDNKKSLIRYHIFPRIIEEEEVLVETDRKWIKFVINQIVINAIKYSKTEKGDKHITFEVKEEKSKIILKIVDEGIGIPKEDINRVFDAFFTGKNGRKTDESTGMGMYLSKKICGELGHDIFAETNKVKGASFSIVFYKGKNIFKL
ncbi:sensor histidine kinase [Clostridium felsineum]|uniref:sensor histidine kinase n=1 Tax=Clostridium felsineum TaxID=36839 RepID=UPI00098CBE50|nr:sensor histidine kinase [Clostridium felsineum]URZ16544.1 Sensor histidine kinase GraS [Clostridium felsineum DSM 794]